MVSDEGDLMHIDDGVVGLEPLTYRQKKLNEHIEIPCEEVQRDYIKAQVHADDSFAVFARKHIA